MKTAIIIPARLNSTRLPRKLLLRETGKTLIEHTYRAALSSKLAKQVVVATDSKEIFDVVSDFGGQSVMTSTAHVSGTDRVAEAANQLDVDLIVNIQGDEPEITGKSIDLVFETLIEKSVPAIATLATPISTMEQLTDTGCVKVVSDDRGRALYFSRSPIPMARDEQFLVDYFGTKAWQHDPKFFQHIGIYGYHKSILDQIPNLPQADIEKIESLEQLRFLIQGWPIFLELVSHSAAGIDTADDYQMFVNRCTNG